MDGGQAEGLFQRLRQGLAKTRRGMAEAMHDLVRVRARVDETLYEEMEALLLGADVGLETTLEVLDAVRERVREQGIGAPQELPALVQDQLRQVLQTAQKAGGTDLGGGGTDPDGAGEGPRIIMIVGVNGSGKTTTAAKLAYLAQRDGRRAMLAAADTFRAAAIDQLAEWGRRLDVDVIHHEPGSDPAAVAFDAVQAARARGVDEVLVDTAGRLHTQKNLMEELKKIRRVLARAQQGAPHEVLLVIDATTGQNALRQAQQFTEAVAVTGIVLTKLDGTARGGIVIAIARQIGIPVRYVGVGETLDDLLPFAADAYLDALFNGRVD